MNATKEQVRSYRDGLRLLGLSRIPRCSVCPRLEAMQEAHEDGLPMAHPVPAIPSTCSYQLCDPLINRLSARGQV